MFGFASTLLRILEQEQPDYLAVSFDTGRTFRHDLYADYKGTRAKMRGLARPGKTHPRDGGRFQYSRLEVENYEADDVIGSLAVLGAYRKKSLGVKIITGDRDLLQLVTNRVVVSFAQQQDQRKRRIFPGGRPARKLGVLPEQVVDYKALVGDPSDNIPGVKGIGEKTAVSLLAQYEAWITFMGIWTKSAAEPALLAAGEGNAYLSQDLARIRTET